MVPPPRVLGSLLIALLREIYRRAMDVPNGPAHFHVAVEGALIPARILVDESENERGASIILDLASDETKAIVRSYLKAQAERPGDPSGFAPSQDDFLLEDSVLRTADLRRSGDLDTDSLALMLDFALDCRKEKLEVVEKEDSTVVYVFNDDDRTLVSRSTPYNNPKYLDSLAEIEPRARRKSGNGVATFQVVGLLHQATATLTLGESEGTKHATLSLDYTSSRDYRSGAHS